VAKNPKHMALLTRTMLIGQAVTETTDIYAMVVSLMLIFVV
jgi:F-type H+-transporting ATPase subunit c